MVGLAAISQANERFASERHAGLVGVFVGATSGIGAGTLEKLIIMLEKPTCYVIGRSESRFAPQRERLETANAGCKIIFLEAEVSLLFDVDAVCKKIAESAQRVDFLYMSPGGIPWNGPEYTNEGLEVSFAISYYSRIRFITNLLPLLRKSHRPRVLSVLNAGREQAMIEDDMDLQRNWSMAAVIKHTTTMMSLALEHLAENDKEIAFVHAFPGFVCTDIFVKLRASARAGVAGRMLLALVRVVAAIVMSTIASSTTESGARQAFHLTSDSLGPGAWRIDNYSEEIKDSRVLSQYRERGWTKRVWEHTAGVFEATVIQNSSAESTSK